MALGSGTLRLWEGTWYTRMKVWGLAVTIVGVEEGGVILSGAARWHTLVSSSNQSELTLRRLTLDRSENGPAVVVDSHPRLTDVDFVQHEGGHGTGGFEVLRGEVGGEDAAFDWHQGVEGAAQSALTLERTTVRLNSAINGGRLVLPDATVSVLDSRIGENDASNRGAGTWATNGARVDCVSADGPYGGWGKVVRRGGAVYRESSMLAASSNLRVTSGNCDWTDGDDNRPKGVRGGHNTTSWDFEDNVQVVYEAADC